ncbi:MAG: LCP family protein [Oscillospiraceae bacterium]|nr:LCP family protein [Oscillospiraceae bacterium]MBQ9980974.1 LCP family protein [Oscillospiraceae bacterium]
MFMFKKRKKESVAIPFLASMMVTLILVGLPVSKIYSQLLEKKEASETTKNSLIFTPTSKNDTTILFVYDTDDNALRDSFAVLRTSAQSKSFIFIPVSNDMLCDNKKMSDIYKQGGVIELQAAVEKTLDIDVQRYMKLNDEAFTLICDALGGVNYNVPDGLRGLNEGTQYLSSEYILKLVSNKKFAEDARTVTIGAVMADMISQTTGNRVSDALDYTFNSLINIVQTDITSIDYDNQKKAIEYIFNSNQFKASYRIPTGESTKAGLKVDKEFIDKIQEELGI